MSHLFHERQVPFMRHLRGGNPAHRRIFTAAREARHSYQVRPNHTFRGRRQGRTWSRSHWCRIWTPAALVILMVAVVPQKNTSKMARLGTGLEGAQ